MILAAIGDKKGPIDDVIRDFDNELDRMQERLLELNERQNAVQEESNEAGAVQTARQREYDDVNNKQQSITNKLSEMETLRADITKADDTTDVASMYFLTLEFHSQLRETHIMSQHELSMELRQKLGELEAAKENARAKSAALSAAQAEYTSHKTELDNRRKERRTKLLAEVENMFPVPSVSTAEGGTAGTAPVNPAATPKK
jgi:DNA repair exonuclease SbcCD ATPase subunit